MQKGRNRPAASTGLILQHSVQMWWYKTWVWQWIEGQRLSGLQGAARPTIAFHVRGGDIFAADKAQARPLRLTLHSPCRACRVSWRVEADLPWKSLHH